MLELLRNTGDLLDKLILKKNIAFFEWQNLTFQEKQAIQIKNGIFSIEDPVNWRFDSDEEDVYQAWKWDNSIRHFCEYLENLLPDTSFSNHLSEFKMIFMNHRILRPFLKRSVIRKYLSNLLEKVKEDLFEDYIINRRVKIIKRAFQDFLEAIPENSHKSKYNSFIIDIKTLIFFGLSTKEIIDFLNKKENDFYFEETENTLKISVLEVEKIYLLNILYISVKNNSFNIIFNLGNFGD